MLLTKRWLGGAEASAANAEESARKAPKARPEGAAQKRSPAAPRGEEEEQGASKAGSQAAADGAPAGEKKRKERTKDRSERKKDRSAVGEEAEAPKKAAKKGKKKRKNEPLPIKEPEVAAAYLEGWAAKQAGSDDAWRFNKATQAWILRHAYEADKIGKAAFKVLLRYLEGLQGAARDRLRSEAEAVVVLRGAPVRQAEPEPARRLKGAALKKKKAEERKAAAAKVEQEIKDLRMGAEIREAKEEPAGAAEAPQDEPQEEETLTEEEVKARALRMARAEKMLAVVGSGAEEAEEAEE